MATCTKLGDTLDNFLRRHYNDYSSQRMAILECTKMVLGPILIELGRRESLFDFEPVNSLTFYEVKSTNAVEVLLCFKHFDCSTDALSIEDGQTPVGFALTKLNGKKTVWDGLCAKSNSGKKYLSPRLISEQLLEQIGRMVNEDSFPHFANFKAELETSLNENAVTLKISGYTHEDYFVSIIPTIPCRGRWTFSAHAWQTEESYWPSKAMRQEAIAGGIHLVGRSSPTKSPYQWQLAFLEPMRKFLADSSGCRSKCLMVMNLLLMNTHALQKGVTEFHLKTIIMHLNKKFPVVAFWQEEKFAQRFIDTVTELLSCVREKKLPDFFLTDLNLIKDLSKSSLELWESQLKKILDNPQVFLDNFESLQQNTAF